MYCAVCARVIGRSLHRPGVKEFYDATPLREPRKSFLKLERIEFIEQKDTILTLMP